MEAAEHLKDDQCNTSDHEETTSLRTDTSDTSVTSGQGAPPSSGAASATGTQGVNGASSAPEKDPPAPNSHYQDDPEAFRNNSIACLRAKAQEHQAKLLNHGLMLQVRSLANMTHAQQPNCDANANNLNLHHGDIVNSDTSSSMF